MRPLHDTRTRYPWRLSEMSFDFLAQRWSWRPPATRLETARHNRSYFLLIAALSFVASGEAQAQLVRGGSQGIAWTKPPPRGHCWAERGPAGAARARCGGALE